MPPAILAPAHQVMWYWRRSHHILLTGASRSPSYRGGQQLPGPGLAAMASQTLTSLELSASHFGDLAGLSSLQSLVHPEP